MYDVADHLPVVVDRELRMIDLKREVNALSVRLGEPPPYAAATDI